MMKIQNSTDINSFASEDLQEKLRWKKFLEWNNATKFFNEEDLLGILYNCMQKHVHWKVIVDLSIYAY